MQAEQAKTENLLLVEEVAHVRAREPRAGRAAAALLERPPVARELAGLDVQLALPGERAAGPRVPRRQDAVEHVDPALDHLEDADGVADPHEVARPVAWEQPGRPRRRVEHLLAGLADRQPAERVAVEAELGDLLDAAAAELGVGAALRDAEHELARAALGVQLAPRPERRAADGLLELAARRSR